MKKKIEDYLPYYLGCRITNYPYGMYHDTLKDKMLIGILNGINTISHKIHIQNYDILGREWGELTESNVDRCMPILRPTSEMTEEEKKEGQNIIRLDKWGGPTIESMSEVTRYLLKKNFDVFNLHSEGLCIYQSEIKTEINN